MSASIRRYYTDSYTTSFDANIVERLTAADKPAVVLDQTFFYPTSGGQPHDLGRLGDAQVVDVSVRTVDGAVIHVLDREVTSDWVDGRIDWRRRFDHMQQHTGQHVLSQAFIRVANAATIGFHLGKDYVSIDVDDPNIEAGSIGASVEMANEIIEQNVEIKAWFPTAFELEGLPLRKTPDVEGAIRVVAIGDFDFSACGGTHLARTGEIGIIHGLKAERLKRGTRISFLCGRRARRDYAVKHAITSRLSAALTCSVEELPEAVGRLQPELETVKKELLKHREGDLGREALELRLKSDRAMGCAVIKRAWPDRSPEELRTLALRSTSERDTLTLLASWGARSHFVFARSENLAADLRVALDAALATIGGGKGGGSRVVQGGGGPATEEQVLHALSVALEAVMQ